MALDKEFYQACFKIFINTTVAIFVYKVLMGYWGPQIRRFDVEKCVKQQRMNYENLCEKKFLVIPSTPAQVAHRMGASCAVSNILECIHAE